MSGEEKVEIVAPPEGDIPKFHTPADLKRQRGHRGRRWLRRCGRLGLWLVTLACALGLGVVILLDKRIDAPGWLRAQAEARLEQQLGGLQIEFGQIEMVVHRGWRPRLSLRDVTLFYPDGTVAMQLEDAQASLAMRPLLRGEVRPKEIFLSGLLATLQRGSDGAVALSFSEGTTPFRQARNLPQLIDASIQESPMDARMSLYESIVLSGGSTMFKNLNKRLKRDIKGISQKALSQTLKKLERDGLVSRTVHPPRSCRACGRSQW